MLWSHIALFLFVKRLCIQSCLLCWRSPVSLFLSQKKRDGLLLHSYTNNSCKIFVVFNFSVITKTQKLQFPRSGFRELLTWMSTWIKMKSSSCVTSAWRKEREVEVGWVSDREMKQDGIKAKVGAQFLKGQDIITYSNACSTGGHGNAFSSA